VIEIECNIPASGLGWWR